MVLTTRTRNILKTLILSVNLATQASSNQDCDDLASLEADPNSVSSPVAFKDIQPRAVIEACSRAISIDNEHKPRFLLHRARGYLKGGKSEKALLDLENAHKLGYPAATFGLATAYFLGDDVPQDLGKAKQLFMQSYENGVFWSARGIALIYADEMYKGYDPVKAKKWESKFKSGN